MKIISPIIICVILLLIFGCSDFKRENSSITDKNPSIEPPTTIANSESDSTEEVVSTDPPVSTPELGNIKEDKYYSIKYKQSLVQLRDDEKTVVHILGEPDEASQVKQLGDGADTFSDMYSKHLYYSGLTLKFLGMEKSSLWLSEIILDKNEYETSEGIKVGDHLEKLKNAYSNIKYEKLKTIDNKPNLKIYEYFQGDLGFFAEFIVNESDVIEEIHMYFLFD
ncbi:hypothetical protein GCM10008014_34570 [Paenibacillus silvae]|uniref:DUF4309 domain-containing protein n=1 Tax=Paenibacillus silvae TaxID=1325358 RepID=A0ABQ1ZFU2_9BACL|nr:hypothetical protein [Paenibacillus silvae]GGH60231.1 hypothetical protein GCM10008014_34570 [Paenibacillus silvae]